MEDDEAWKPYRSPVPKKRKRARGRAKWTREPFDPAKHGPPIASSIPIDEAGLTGLVEVSRSKVQAVAADMYIPKAWRSLMVRDTWRYDLSKFLQNRATTKGQSAIDKLWIEGWESQAKFWPQEQARAYCNFALRPFRPCIFKTIESFHWYREPQFNSPSCVFYVHGWLCVKREGRASLERKYWFRVWNKMYNVNALNPVADGRWEEAASGFYDALHPSGEAASTNLSPNNTSSTASTRMTPSISPRQERPTDAPQLTAPRIRELSDQDWAVMTNAAYAIVKREKASQSTHEKLSEAEYDKAVQHLNARKAEEMRKLCERYERELEFMERRQHAEEDADLAREFVNLVTKVRCGEDFDENRFGALFAFVHESLEENAQENLSR